MARIYQPRLRKSDERWDMTVSSDEEGWCHAIGYCAGFPEYDEDRAKRLNMEDGLRREHDKALPFKAKYHEDGHATAAEAATCYHDFELDRELRFHDSSNDQRRCEAQNCGVWTQGRAELGQFRHFTVCDKHKTRADIEQILAAKKEED